MSFLKIHNYISKIDVTHFDSEKDIPKTQERMEGEINFTPILIYYFQNLEFYYEVASQCK